jgi:hypothetical protein
VNTCKTCKHWEKQDHLEEIVRVCLLSKSDWKMDDPKQFLDAEQYGGVLTGPDFGCILHEPLNENPQTQQP